MRILFAVNEPYLPEEFGGGLLGIHVVALLPHRKFLFVESWTLSSVAKNQLNIQLRSLPNVSFRSHSPSMKNVYERTLLLLAPSQ